MTSRIIFSKPWESGLFLLRDNQVFKIREDTQGHGFDLPKYMRWSPDGTKIAFRSGHGDSISIIHATGEHVSTPISGSGDRDCLYPAWSPDGKWLTYCRVSADEFQIRRVRTDGRHDSLIIRLEGVAKALDWSPDGKRFLCVRRLANADLNETLVVHLDGFIETNLGVHTEHPRWSPDGMKIVYANSAVPILGKTYTMHADGSGIVEVAKGIFPDWSADGSQIVYYNSSLFCKTSGFCVVDADGSNPRKILNGAGWYVDWF